MTNKLHTPQDSKKELQIEKSEKPLTADEQIAVKALSRELKASPREAAKILVSDEENIKIVGYRRKVLDLHLSRIVEILQKAIEIKAKRGNLSQAKEGAIALGILREKLFGKEKTSSFSVEVDNRKIVFEVPPEVARSIGHKQK